MPIMLALARRLLADVDILVSNFSRGALAKLGLEATAPKDPNPRLFVTRINSHGRSGPSVDSQPSTSSPRR
ncbi:CoA transferase [Paracoccus homiensis]|uniref:CoA transferase n=1 Tax=Paracoccus homiensis TaxID=364199 RepID=UPI000B859F14|nr:CoA transferase [Paracoccus homiensis]